MVLSAGFSFGHARSSSHELLVPLGPIQIPPLGARRRPAAVEGGGCMDRAGGGLLKTTLRGGTFTFLPTR